MLTAISNIYLFNLARLLLTVLLIGILSAAISCGSGSEPNSSSVTEGELGATGEESEDGLAEVSRIIAHNKTLTFDDYVGAGWKKSKQYDTATVPEATEIWYGFFNSKDIEVRFYDSHEVANTAGFENAANTIDQSFRGAETYGASPSGAGTKGTTKYRAFVVVGNTVMLCELSVENCVDLADVLAQ